MLKQIPDFMDLGQNRTVTVPLHAVDPVIWVSVYSSASPKSLFGCEKTAKVQVMYQSTCNKGVNEVIYSNSEGKLPNTQIKLRIAPPSWVIYNKNRVISRTLLHICNN